MVNPYSRGPRADPRPVPAEAPNAALLIDFDNVTMGMRSDLAKELQTLLGTDIIKGKVTVQRAYADWRRYPQYIVPLSEASIDLIFAPAYGSSKKNATDIRMAIDGMELVFIRPEIGTFILLTGDSDFSSLVLKLKEYGKYVIGIGIQESSSDILVQNCDEYYSYTSLAGLSKTSNGKSAAADPWQCATEALERMASRGDVMRSDRLKQVMMEMSPGFDERNLGFRKFSRFLVEAASRGLMQIERGQNGQYSVALPGDGKAAAGPKAGGAARTGDGGKSGEGRKSGGGAKAGENGKDAGRGKAGERTKTAETPSGREAASRKESPGKRAGDDAHARDGARAEDGARSERAGAANPAPALDLLRRALEGFHERGRHSVRDSTVKRRLLSMNPSFDESALGFSKFSKFLQFAADQRQVALAPLEGGGFEVRLRRNGRESGSVPDGAGEPPRTAQAGGGREHGSAGESAEASVDAKALGLPSAEDAVTSYLANRYRGVGVKTAETLVSAFGPQLFSVLQRDPDKVRKLLPPGRADRVLLAWKEDYERRVGQVKAKAKAAEPVAGRPRGHRGDRPRPRSNAQAANVPQHREPSEGTEEGRRASESSAPDAPGRSRTAQRELAGLALQEEPVVQEAAAEPEKSSGIVGFLKQAARRTRGRGGREG